MMDSFRKIPTHPNEFGFELTHFSCVLCGQRIKSDCEDAETWLAEHVGHALDFLEETALRSRGACV